MRKLVAAILVAISMTVTAPSVAKNAGYDPVKELIAYILITVQCVPRSELYRGCSARQGEEVSGNIRS